IIPVAYRMGWGVGEVGLGAVLGVLLASALAGFLVLLDLRKPMLDWVNPLKAVKSNLNALVGMILGLAFGFALGFLLYGNVQTGTLWLIPLELLAAALALGALVRVLIRRWAPQLWARI
ncbi:MAG TPA: hypothetical protein DCQ17_09440, partial [Firmicutes bacterium]|nr:hypothetical protein [Bacillota bacterium]